MLAFPGPLGTKDLVPDAEASQKKHLLQGCPLQPCGSAVTALHSSEKACTYSTHMAEWASFRADAHLTLSMGPNFIPERSLPDFHCSKTLAVFKTQTMIKISCFYFSTNRHTQIETALLVPLDLLGPSHILQLKQQFNL